MVLVVLVVVVQVATIHLKSSQLLAQPILVAVAVGLALHLMAQQVVQVS
jgi:hypothetical protein